LIQERLEQEQLKQEDLKQEELKQEELKQEELKQDELKQEELKQEEKRLADKEKLKTLKQERLEQEKLKQEKQHKEAEEYQKQLPEQISCKEVKTTTTSTASTQTVLDQLSLVKFGANVAKEEPPEHSVDTKREETTLKTMATLMFASSVVIRHHSTNGSNSVVQETPSTIPMMLQAAIRWASTWTFDSTKHSQNNIHLDVHPSTNNPYSYEQWLAFVQRASRGYTIALNASQEQKDSCKKNGFQEEHATNKSTTAKNEHASLAMFGPLPTEPMDLSDYVSWFHCRMLRAEFDGLNKAMGCCCSGQQKVIMVVPSFATCALLSIASSWDTPLSNGAFEEMVEVSTKMKTATQNIEILVHRNSGLKDAVQARLMAERECKQLPTRRRRNEKSSAVTDTRDLIRVSTQRLMQLVQRSQNTTLRTSYKCLCRCNANGPAELLAGAHHHPTSCISCMTSAFVRYAAACCSIYTMEDRHGTTTETASSNQSNRIQVTFGSEGRMMEEKFRLYTKEDVRCLFVVLGLNNPGDLHPVIVAYDLDVWWSIVYHYGSVSEGLRQIFEAGVAEAIILSFHFFE
jgi:actin-related protein